MYTYMCAERFRVGDVTGYRLRNSCKHGINNVSLISPKFELSL